MYGKEFTEDDQFFFGFMDAEEWVEENQGNMLVSLGIVSYIYECLRDEKSRLGADFTWGIEVDRNAIIEPGQEIIIDVSAGLRKPGLSFSSCHV